MAEPFATLNDLETAWHPLAGDDAARATYLLGRVSRKIRAMDPAIDDRIALWDEDPRPCGALDPETAKDVVCDIVKRTMTSEAEALVPDGPPVETWQRSVGPFQDSFKYANPTGDVYLTKGERQELGIKRQRAFTVDLLSEDAGREPR